MDKIKDLLKYCAFKLVMYLMHHIIPVTIIVVAAVAVIYFTNRDDHVAIENEEKTEFSPTQLLQIENIGEWEFLSISDEELIDTVRHGFFGDDKLSRIYYGTLRLGVKTKGLKSGWIKQEGDSMVCHLPQVTLLDSNFIDEAKTKSFYEEGKWSQEDRETLYNRARNLMQKRCVTPFNIENAQRNAREQFEKLLHSFGYEKVSVKFDNTDKAK